MGIAARALIARVAGQPPQVEDIELAEPGADEVLVAIKATGICHTDLSAAAGRLPVPLPSVLGHEAAGVVEQVGPDVTRVRPGDRVVVAVTHACGRCSMCARGYPPLCEERFQLPPRITAAGESIHQGFGTATFGTHTLLRERSVVPIPDEVPFAIAAVAGCAVATGCGAVFRDAEVRPGSTVLVVGCGGVGLSAVMAAKVAGAARIVAVDPQSTRREAALSVGADEAVEPNAAHILAAHPRGFDYCFESAGVIPAMELAMEVAGAAATITLMGLPAVTEKLGVGIMRLTSLNQRIIGCNMGRLHPDIDFPRYFAMYADGRLPLDALVGTTLPFDQATAALKLAATQGAVRVVLTTP